MLLTLTTTHQPATDLGHLLRKHPDRMHSFELSFGTARVFYPEASETRCTVALQVEVDPVGLVRTRRGPSGEGGLLDQYVNDRPYSASSFLSVALAKVFGTALSGACKDRPELADQPIPLRAELPAVPCRGGVDFLKRLFEPLGYAVSARAFPLDERFPGWGFGAIHEVSLEATLPLHRLLGHLYVLIPVLDNGKHYWIGDDEVEKLLRHGKGWLGSHPEKEWITHRYLKHRRSLATEALERLAGDVTDEAAADTREAMLEEGANADPVDVARDSAPVDQSPPTPTPASDEKEPSLNEQRLNAVLAELKSSGAASVLDLGCGEGKLLRLLLKEKQFTRIVGMDVAHRCLEMASDKLRFDHLPPKQRERIELWHGSLMYRDARLTGFDAAVLVEVVEHLDPPRLTACERVVFDAARPALVIVTTPNREYNVKWETLPAGTYRHRDHRFEWTREEFQEWAGGIADRFGYTVRLLPIGPEDYKVGAPTQMGVFQRMVDLRLHQSISQG